MTQARKILVTPSARILWLCLMCQFLVGCTGGYHRIPIQTGEPLDGHYGAEFQTLETGARIRITMRDKTRIDGRFVECQDSHILLEEAYVVSDTADGFDEILGPRATHFEGTWKFPLDRIVQLEIHETDKAASLAFGSLVVGAAVLVIAATSMTLSWGE